LKEKDAKLEDLRTFMSTIASCIILKYERIFIFDMLATDLCLD